MPIGLITKGVGGVYSVSVGSDIYLCKPRGIFRNMGIVPLPGDNVDISIIENETFTGVIEKVLERSSCLIRPSIANVYKLIIVISASSPKPDLMLLDKLLIMAEKSGVKAIICVNKIDIDCDNVVDCVLNVYGKICGYEVIATCAKDGTGILRIDEMIGAGLVAFAGQSGVGKSTILNDIFDKEVMKTGEVSLRIQRGKHTTRHVELLNLPGVGYIADTPGFTSYDLHDITIDELQACYPEFFERVGLCRFNGCRHLEEPGCEVKRAVKDGDIDNGRYSRYVELCSLLINVKHYDSKFAKHSEMKSKK